VAAILHAVTAYKEALHLRSLVLVSFEKLGHYSALKTVMDLLDDLSVFNNVVSSALVRVIMKLHRLATDIPHEAGFLATTCFVKRDQLLTTLWFKDVR
jgi:hypothetical protein